MGRGLAPIESIEELARFLPALTATTTNRMARRRRAGLRGRRVVAGARDRARCASSSRRRPGCSSPRGRPSRGGCLAPTPPGRAGARSSTSSTGKLHHVASNNASELLGEYLVRRGVISRDELDFALAVLPRYGGRMGDTLISLGLVPSLDIFRAIRDQGRDRLVDLFTWRTGKLTFYADQKSPHVEFPLELELPPLIARRHRGRRARRRAPRDVARPPRRRHRPGVDRRPRPRLRAAAWPPLVKRVLDATDEPKRVRDVLDRLVYGGTTSPASDALRALDLLLLAGLVAQRSEPPGRAHFATGRCRAAGERQDRLQILVVEAELQPEEVIAQARLEDVVDAAESHRCLMNSYEM